MSNKLPKVIDERIEKLCAEGHQHVGSRRFDAAVLSFKAAFDLLPPPKERWKYTPDILSSITDACFLKGDFDNAHDAIDAAMQCPDAKYDPQVHLRCGKVLYELGRVVEAGSELALAFQAGGKSLFSDEDPKYLKLVRGAG